MAENKIETIPFKQRVTMAQATLKAPKGQYNNFGKYKYRSAEDILEAVKPINNEFHLTLTINDEIVLIGERFYLKATANLADMHSNESLSVAAYAREPQAKKGMDESQITGGASSYARKYALNGLYLIDDTKEDPDMQKPQPKENKQKTSGSESAFNKRRGEALQRIRRVNEANHAKEGTAYNWVMKQIANVTGQTAQDITPENIEIAEKAIERLEKQRG